MQSASDVFLGWQRMRGLDGQTRDYYVRQLHDWKGSAEVEDMQVPGATFHARICGEDAGTGPRPLGRSDRHRLVPGEGREFDRAIADFSAAYADQNERDYEALVKAVKSGRLHAETGL